MSSYPLAPFSVVRRYPHQARRRDSAPGSHYIQWGGALAFAFGCLSCTGQPSDQGADTGPADTIEIVGSATAGLCSYSVHDVATNTIRELPFELLNRYCDPVLSAFMSCDAGRPCLTQDHCENGLCMKGPGVACKRDTECMTGASCVGIDWSVDQPGICKSDSVCLDATGEVAAEGTSACTQSRRRCVCTGGDWVSCTADVACGSQCDATHSCANSAFTCTNGTCMAGAADHLAVIGSTSMFPTCPGAQVYQRSVLVVVLDAAGLPVPGVDISFTVPDDGVVEFPTATSNELGIVRPGKWTARDTYGTSRLVVSGTTPLPGKSGNSSIALSVEVKDFPVCHMKWDGPCQTITPPTVPMTPPDLTAWLGSHPRVAANLRLVVDDVPLNQVPTSVAWADWPSADQTALVRELVRILTP